MRWLVMLLALSAGVLSMNVSAQAQALKVDISDISTKSFTWTAPVVDAKHGAADHYNMKCRSTPSGEYLIKRVDPVPPSRTPPTEVLVKQVLTTPGIYFCVVTAENRFGESDPSNEININADSGANASLTESK